MYTTTHFRSASGELMFKNGMRGGVWQETRLKGRLLSIVGNRDHPRDLKSTLPGTSQVYLLLYFCSFLQKMTKQKMTRTSEKYHI